MLLLMIVVSAGALAPAKANYHILCGIAEYMVEEATENNDPIAALEWSEIYRRCQLLY
jgi:hypothetical protein